MTGICWQVVPAPTPFAGRKRGSQRTWRRAGALNPLERASLRAIAPGFWPGGEGGGPGPPWAPPGSQARLHKEASLLL